MHASIRLVLYHRQRDGIPAGPRQSVQTICGSWHGSACVELGALLDVRKVDMLCRDEELDDADVVLLFGAKIVPERLPAARSVAHSDCALSQKGWRR